MTNRCKFHTPSAGLQSIVKMELINSDATHLTVVERDRDLEYSGTHTFTVEVTLTGHVALNELLSFKEALGRMVLGADDMDVYVMPDVDGLVIVVVFCNPEHHALTAGRIVSRVTTSGDHDNLDFNCF